ncbi:hypothetical protein MPTK1_8g17640 [Marchantia polymorpha subsp. ruderalis]|nr:hypothetical protein MARPO_0030s0099 [Marchantia polymorpha]BBN20246.1 hypothetical protein Mp_8g17640 [Marchantia polymorpha subsp. ruderalis]|eukprot:PTQ42366.1 hypothetical protein MARPO_0030s0099 [Marchantia polymorpha]
MADGVGAENLVQELRDVFATGRTKNFKWRVEQLRGLARFASEMEKEICEAVHKDLSKPAFECYTSEIATLERSAKDTEKDLPKWMKPQKTPVPIAAQPGNAQIISEPLGVVLVISAWNYPVWLSLEPVLGAIAAGNCVVLKPSELAPAVSALLAKYIPLYVDSSAVKVVEGGIPETTELLEQKWDKIFYTGNGRVGRIILTAAAKHLTPVVLELGGKSPVIVDSTADIEVAARRISWGKWASNNGQACISPDYILAEESIVPKLISNLKDSLKAFYGDDVSKGEISRIVNKVHYNRLLGLVNEERTLDKVVHGGETNENNLYIAPTIILDPPQDSPIMQEEIFGPLLVILTVKSVDQAIKFVNSRPKPLALYVFSNSKAVQQQVIEETSSGGVTVNDTMLHVATSGLPFGGVGDSGMGAYHGVHSFNVFSHKKAVLYRGFRADNSIRYPPYTNKKQRLIRALMSGNFLGLILILIGLK